MSGKIMVELRPPTELGQLYPVDPPDPGLLEVSTRVPWTPGDHVVIDDILMLDVDTEGILVSFDLMSRPPELVLSAPNNRPPAEVTASVEVLPETLREHVFDDINVRETTDEERSYVLIELDSPRSPTVVKLSESCLAFVEDDCLAGFYIDLR